VTRNIVLYDIARQNIHLYVQDDQRKPRSFTLKIFLLFYRQFQLTFWGLKILAIGYLPA
jgi:hypothetical protein